MASSLDEVLVKGASLASDSSPSREMPAKAPSKTSPRRSRSPDRPRSSRRSKSPDADSDGGDALSEDGEASDTAPPLPQEPLPESTDHADARPPLPQEPPPVETADDGWDAQWDANTGAWYYLNRFTGISQWENPRVPHDPYTQASATAAQTPSGHAPGTEPSSLGAPGTSSEPAAPPSPPPGPYLGYNPKIHGDFDPNADYAKFHQPEKAQEEPAEVAAEGADMIGTYGQQATFNRFTGAFQGGSKNSEYHNDDNKSKRQMNAFFDVDKAANVHDGKSLKAERATQKLSKQQVKAFNEQRRAKKEQKRREFLMN